MDEVLSCSLCKDRLFDDVVKLIVECGSSVCKRCYEELKEDANEAEGRFKCSACSEEHIMPPTGLPDNKVVLKLIRNLPKKAMPESARELEKQVRDLDVQIEKLKAFDSAELVELKCQQLELEVQSGFASAVDHLKKIEANMLSKISEYKSECLKNLAARSTKPGQGDEELTRLSREIESFIDRWKNYYKRIEVYESESDIEAARVQAAEFFSAIQSTEKRLAEDAYGRKKVTFTLNSQFLKNWDHVGAVEIITDEQSVTQEICPPLETKRKPLEEWFPIQRSAPFDLSMYLTEPSDTVPKPRVFQKISEDEKQELEKQVRELKDQFEKLQAFDGAELVELKCQQVEQKVQDAITSAVDHLKKIEEKMLGKIGEYKSECLKNLAARSTKPSQEDEKLAKLSREISSFSARWNEYFKDYESYENESNIEAARTQAAEFSSAIQSTEKSLAEEAYGRKNVVFKLNPQFLKNWDHFGAVEIVEEQSKSRQISPPPPLEEPAPAAIELKYFEYFESEIFREANTHSYGLEEKKNVRIGRSPSLTLTGHTKSVHLVIFLSDGRLASCSDDCTIKIWDLKSGRELFTLAGHSDWVYTAVILPNGHLASGCKDGTIKLWNLTQRKEICTIRAHSATILSLCVLRNGILVSFSMDDTIKFWDLRQIMWLVKDPFFFLSQRDSFLLGKPLFVCKGHGNVKIDVALFGMLSNQNLVSCSTGDDPKSVCTLRVWTLGKAAPIKSIPTGMSTARSLLVCSNDHVVLGSESGRIEIYDVAKEVLLTLKETGHPVFHRSLAMLSNGYLINGNGDSSENADIRVWNLSDWSLLQTIATGHSDRVNSLCVSGDEKFLASGSQDGTIKLWPISIQ